MRCVHSGRKGPLSVYEVTENLNLAINAAMAIGCRVVNIGSGDIMTGSPHLVPPPHDCLWMVARDARQPPMADRTSQRTCRACAGVEASWGRQAEGVGGGAARL